MRHLSLDNIAEALEMLRQGGVIVYPTETSYGMGCDATNIAAVERVFVMKNRPMTKALSVILPSLKEADKYVNFRPYSRRLAAYYWPGPLTIVATALAESTMSPHCASKGRHALRVSSHPFAAALAAGLGRPIVATSANLSGQHDIYRAGDVLATYDAMVDGPDAFVNGGDLPVVPPSTIVEVGAEGINVLRQGSIVVREVW